jgi:hypothetical protein
VRKLRDELHTAHQKSEQDDDMLARNETLDRNITRQSSNGRLLEVEGKVY